MSYLLISDEESNHGTVNLTETLSSMKNSIDKISMKIVQGAPLTPKTRVCSQKEEGQPPSGMDRPKENSVPSAVVNNIGGKNPVDAESFKAEVMRRGGWVNYRHSSSLGSKLKEEELDPSGLSRIESLIPRDDRSRSRSRDDRSRSWVHGSKTLEVSVEDGMSLSQIKKKIEKKIEKKSIKRAKKNIDLVADHPLLRGLHPDKEEEEESLVVGKQTAAVVPSQASDATSDSLFFYSTHFIVGKEKKEKKRES